MFSKGKELVDAVLLEDTTFLQELMVHINACTSVASIASTVLRPLTAAQLALLTDNQVCFLYFIPYKFGDHISLEVTKTSEFDKRLRRLLQAGIPHYAPPRYRHIAGSMTHVAKEDLKIFSNYCRTVWRRSNPSTRSKKGTALTFSMDMFSLAVFKETAAKKPFLRTESKNYIMGVNKAFRNTPITNATISIRNKFYAVILDNTADHTKALQNELIPTSLLDNSTYYLPAEDEALTIYFGRASAKPLISYLTLDAIADYSTDLTLTTHNNGYVDDRDNNRLVSMASMLLTAYVATGHEPYNTLAIRALKNIKAEHRTKVLTKIAAIEALCTILKETHE